MCKQTGGPGFDIVLREEDGVARLAAMKSYDTRSAVFCYAAVVWCAVAAGLAAARGTAKAGKGSGDAGGGIEEFVTLRRGEFRVRWFDVPEGKSAESVALLASGDGGWSRWEEGVAARLAGMGCLVAGMDMQDYARTDFDEETLGADFAAVARLAGGRAGAGGLPVVYAGWSMGAVEAAAAAAWPGRPKELAGVVMVSAGKRGRYGLRFADRMGLAPTGAGTFAMQDLTGGLEGLRVAQIQGGLDFISSTEWMESLLRSPARPGPAASRLIRVEGANHGLNGPDEEGYRAVEEAVRWVLAGVGEGRDGERNKGGGG